MPSLIYQHSGLRRGGVIDGRVLIGRKLSHGVLIDDPAVSRLHAWILQRDGAFVLNDAGSRSGTFVNGLAVARCELRDGDEIRVGPVSLTFSSQDELPADVERIELSTRKATVTSSRAGTLFDCTCGAPLWLNAAHAAKKVRCTHCGETVQPPSVAAPSISAATLSKSMRARVKCGVCHSLVADVEETTACAQCGTTFHADCWTENFGCSSYGCPQVNALKPATEAVTGEAPAAEPSPPPRTSWDVLLLAGSVVGSIVGSLLFGAPAAIIGAASLLRLVTGKSTRRTLLMLAILLSVVGTIGGLALSDFWWLGGRYIEALWP